MMFVKVRQKPFSVYMYFLAPEDRKGQEANHVEGLQRRQTLGHTSGLDRQTLGHPAP